MKKFFISFKNNFRVSFTVLAPSRLRSELRKWTSVELVNLHSVAVTQG